MQIKKFFKYFGLAVAILVGGFVVAGQIAHYAVPVIDPPGQIYSVNGMDKHLYCTGPQNDQRPTIIIINGAGVQGPLYYPLQETLSETIRTCTYDRAGFGWSQPNSVAANAKNMSDELFELLEVAKIKGPIILAGHSLGGLVSLIYSAEHEEQVAGIAFIDSSHPNQYDYFGQEFSDEIYRQNEELLSSLWRAEIISKLGILNLAALFVESPIPMDDQMQKMFVYFETWNPPYTAVKSEIANLQLSMEQGNEVLHHRGDLPIVSLSASHIDFTFFPPTELSEQEMNDAFKSFREELADLSTRGKHEVVNGTDHFSILFNDATPDHILSLVSVIES